MKHRIISTLMAFYCIAWGYAENIFVSDVTLKPGETKDLQVSLSSSISNNVGVQFDVTLPDGLSLGEGNDGKVYQLSSNQTSDLTCYVSNIGNGSFRFVLYSGTLNNLREGELLNLHLKSGSSTTLGSYTVSFSEIAFSDYDGNVTMDSEVNATIKVTDFFTLLYQVDGVDYKSYVLEYGETVTPEPEPTKEGHTFSGWSEIPVTMPAHDVTVTGTFSVNKYYLTYIVDGQTYKTYDLEYGSVITPEAAPVKEGYTFSGWSGVPETMPAHDVTVIGTFSINQYKLTYLVDGEVYKTYELDYGTVITPESEPIKEGYTFSGWSEIPETMPAHDVTITGSFAVNKYKLTYLVDGEEYRTYELDYGTAITPEPAPFKEGYSFSGWSEIPETMPANDVIVTGSFSINKYKLTYTIDGEEYKSYEIEYGASITPETEPTKEGYTFSGWSEIPETMPAHDVTVIGTFSINQYSLTYLVDSEEYKTYNLDYGTIITPEAEPTKEGYTFSGWSEIPAIMPAHDVTVKGTFSINSYKLTYMIDNEVHKEVVYEYGATITPEPQPEGDYLTFEWVGVPETMPAHDVVVTAVYETGIIDILTLQGIKAIYTPNGKKLDKPQKGLNIIVMQDGTVRKVYVK